jgi:hypothetical protein
MTSHYLGNVSRTKYPRVIDWLEAGPDILKNGTLYWRFPLGTYGTFRFEQLYQIPKNFCSRYRLREVKPMFHNPEHQTRGRKGRDWQQFWGPAEVHWAKKNLRDLVTYGYKLDAQRKVV